MNPHAPPPDPFHRRRGDGFPLRDGHYLTLGRAWVPLWRYDATI
jgi:hypothetical protein